MPSLYFETSCARKIMSKQRRYEASGACTKGQQAIQSLFEDMSNGPDPSFNDNSRQEILQSVGVSKNEASAIASKHWGKVMV